MNIKEFLKPTAGKTLVLIILLLITIVPSQSVFLPQPTGGGISYGFPFSIYMRTCEFSEVTLNCEPTAIVSYNLEFVVVNIIIWYLISCLIIFAYIKVKKK